MVSMLDLNVCQTALPVKKNRSRAPDCYLLPLCHALIHCVVKSTETFTFDSILK